MLALIEKILKYLVDFFKQKPKDPDKPVIDEVVTDDPNSQEKFIIEDKLSPYWLVFKDASLKNEEFVLGQAEKLASLFDRYKEIELETGVPYWVVAILHRMESDSNFKTHLHNGDSLNDYTVQVPQGRPKKGTPPFSFTESAIDALKYDKIDQTEVWSIDNILELFEKWNGFGYKKKGVPSPFLWSYTNKYIKGKYTGDGFYDPDAVSKQIGCAAYMLAFIKLGYKLQGLNIDYIEQNNDGNIIVQPLPENDDSSIGLILYDKAKKYIGVGEYPGSSHNPDILDFWEKAGLDFDDDETPWCAGFANAVCVMSGYRSTKSGMARSFMSSTYYRKIKKPIKGCIVVFWRGTPSSASGHVAFFDRIANGSHYVLGGNQNNEVNISTYDNDRVLGYYLPKS
jgi:uncharacterized protein (TIGR02594 family)